MKPNIKPATTRDELLDLLWAKYPKGWFKTTEAFDGHEGGIWTGENSMMDDGTPMFDFSFGYDPKERFYVLDVRKPFKEFIESHGWFAECYDPGTWMLWMI